MANPLDNLKPFNSESASEAGKKSSREGIPNTKTRLKRLLEIVQDKKNPFTGEFEGFTVAEQMDMAMILKAVKGDTKAYQALVDRLEGKPSQSVDMTTGGDKIAPVTIIDLGALNVSDQPEAESSGSSSQES